MNTVARIENGKLITETDLSSGSLSGDRVILSKFEESVEGIDIDLFIDRPASDGEMSAQADAEAVETESGAESVEEHCGAHPDEATG